MLRRMTGLSLRYFFINTFGRACIVTLLALIVPYLIITTYTIGLTRFIMDVLCSELCALLLILLIGLTGNEKRNIINKLTQFVQHAE